MRVGVFLGGQAPTSGGGFTLQDDIGHALARAETKHTFVIFGEATKDQAASTAGGRVLSVRSQGGLCGWLISKVADTMNRSASTTFMARSVVQLPIVRDRIRYAHLRRTIEHLGIEILWFVTPGYIPLDVPYIFTIWDMQHRLQPWFPEVSANGQWRFREELYATAIPRAWAIIVGAEAGKQEIVHFYRVPPERVKLLPHPTPSFALRSPKDTGKEVLAKYHIPAGYLFYPAQFWPHKNHVGLLVAVSLLRQKYDMTLHLVFVGSDMGNLRYVRQMVDKLGLSNQVHFLGFVPREDMVGLYQNAFALTYLTFFGPENLPPLEAFALGCPVIASSVPGAQEQLGDAALLVDPKNEGQIASAIKRLYDDPALRDTLISRGRTRASKWTADDLVESICRLIDEFEPVRRCWGTVTP